MKVRRHTSLQAVTAPLSPSWRMLSAVGSGRVALLLVALVLLFCLVGAVVPQSGRVSASQLLVWQVEHHGLHRILEPLGGYRVFHSWGFLAVLFCLALNTAACTLYHAVVSRRTWWAQPGGAIRWTGFLVLHVSLVALITSGMVSGATRHSGRIVLIEGQTFKEGHDAYDRLAAGPLRRHAAAPFSVALREVRMAYARQRFPIETGSVLEISRAGEPSEVVEIRVNRPASHDGVAITQDVTGYAPRIRLRNIRTGRVRSDAFMALQTFTPPAGLVYRDVMPLPFGARQLMVTLYPSHALEGDEVVKTAETPDNPVLLLHVVEADGTRRLATAVPLGQEREILGHMVAFTDLRRWAAFGVSRDGGYVLFMVALWGGVLALVLRYAPELSGWIKEAPCDEG